MSARTSRHYSHPLRASRLSRSLISAAGPAGTSRPSANLAISRLASMARPPGHSGCEVWHQEFLRLDLPAAYFDGIFANAALFHVPCQELARVLKDLDTALKPGGVLFSSNPRGRNEEGWSSGRYGAYHDFAAWRRYLTGAGFTEILHYYRPPGLPRDQQPWLASAWRKPK